MLPLYVCTYQRKEQQTASALRAAGYDPILVLSESDLLMQDAAFISGWDHIVFNVYSICTKRQALLEHCSRIGQERFVMFDDDLRFRARLPGTNKFPQATPADVARMLNTIDEQLNTRAHGGIRDEYMCGMSKEGISHSGRYNQVLAYNLDLIGDKLPEFRLTCNEEHDVSLQLQDRGLELFILQDFTKGHKGYKAGGANASVGDSRAEQERLGHERLAELWPHLVKVVPNPNQLSGVGIRVQWSKALRKGA